MASTYTWDNILTFVKPFVRDIPTGDINTLAIDRVNRTMWKRFFFHWTLAELTSISLSDGTQDYAISDTDFYRPFHMRVTRTDTTPDIANDVDILEFLPPQLELQGSLYSFRAVAVRGTSTIRLDRAASITGSTTMQIDGEYQTVPAKITSTSTTIVFPDDYVEVAQEGLKWAYMALKGDNRTGGVSFEKRTGSRGYTGQYAVFMSLLDDMAQAEDTIPEPVRFPSDSMGSVRATGSDLFGWG
jgi:hypothetical protein|tara:strand:- start:287 stop:1015 length:729 start_codon:yes stop_codon:yes gene_type:complete